MSICLPHSLFSAVIKNPIQKSYKAYQQYVTPDISLILSSSQSTSYLLCCPEHIDRLRFRRNIPVKQKQTGRVKSHTRRTKTGKLGLTTFTPGIKVLFESESVIRMQRGLPDLQCGLDHAVIRSQPGVI